jgi:hypothetical protein
MRRAIQEDPAAGCFRWEPDSYATRDLTRGHRWKEEDSAGWRACCTPACRNWTWTRSPIRGHRGALVADADPPGDAGRPHGRLQEFVGERAAHGGACPSPPGGSSGCHAGSLTRSCWQRGHCAVRIHGERDGTEHLERIVADEHRTTALRDEADERARGRSLDAPAWRQRRRPPAPPARVVPLARRR